MIQQAKKETIQGHCIYRLHLKVKVTDYNKVKYCLGTLLLYVDDLVFSANNEN